jgi:ABC-2 type transport system ATP-binding protein
MDEAEHLADRVAIIVQGKIVDEGTPGDLVRREGSTIIRFKVRPGAGSPPEDLGAETAGDDGGYTITTGTPTPSLNRLTGWAMEQAIDLEELSVSSPTLEDVFIELVGAFERGGEEE